MKKGVNMKLFRQLNKSWGSIIRETQKYNTLERNTVFFGPGFTNMNQEYSWEPSTNKTLHSYEIAESEEKETSPTWGDVKATDITFEEN